MSDIFVSAIAYLARRDHSELELKEKLLNKGYAVPDVEEVLEHCKSRGFQSDRRFVESMLRSKMNQGYGPLRITQWLSLQGIPRAMMEEVFLDEDPDWVALALRVWEKKYKRQTDVSLLARQKQKQFLLYRGFSSETIRDVFERLNINR